MVFPIVFLVICGAIAAATIGIATLVGREPGSPEVEAPKPVALRPATPKPTITPTPPGSVPPAGPGRPSAEPSAGPEAASPVAPTPLIAPVAPPTPVAPTPVIPAPVAVPRVEERLSVAVRLRRTLSRSRQAIGEKLVAIVGRGNLDEDAWEDIEEALIRADVGVEATTAMLGALRRQKLKPSELPDALRQQLVTILERSDRTLRFAEKPPTVWLITGVNGTGKTTSVAKLAKLLQDQGRSVVLAAADTFRAAAIDQLGTWADRLGVHMIRHAPGADPGAVVFDAIEYAEARGIDVVLVDTAGRLHTKSPLMEELKKIRRIADRKAVVAESLLVLDATVGQNGIAQARTFGEAVSVTGVILTKLDGSARGGIVVAIQEELGIPVKAVGVGEGMADLEIFDPQAFADALVGIPDPVA